MTFIKGYTPWNKGKKFLAKDNNPNWKGGICCNNPDEYRRKWQRKHRKENPEHYKFKDKKWYWNNKEKSREKGKKWREKNKEYLKQYEEKRKEKRKEYNKNRKNSIAYKERRNQRLKWIRALNPKFKVNQNISCLIYYSLKRKKERKHWETLVKYTLKDLMTHLEKQFDENMNWKNYGSYWSIDHIKPISLFSYSSFQDPEFQECWALNNLQPLEKIENIKKGGKNKWLQSQRHPSIQSS